MTYLEFHLIFTLPVIILLALVQRRPLAGIGGWRATWALPAIAALAFVYTTPWDNYLIWRDVWSYGRDRVLGTLGYVPFEEYLFFLLQPILTGLWLYWLLARQPDVSGAQPSAAKNIRLVGTLIWLAVSVVGGLLLQWSWGVYLGLILAWASPILALQWWFGGAQLWSQKRLWLIATWVPTLYLWVADRIAIAQDIWHISETYTTGFKLLGLPIEEATFFWITNLLVVQGLILILQLDRLPLSLSNLAKPSYTDSSTAVDSQ